MGQPAGKSAASAGYRALRDLPFQRGVSPHKPASRPQTDPCLQPAGKHVRTNGQLLYVVDSGGTGEAVVLMHDHKLWRHQVSPLGPSSALSCTWNTQACVGLC